MDTGLLLEISDWSHVHVHLYAVACLIGTPIDAHLATSLYCTKR